MQIDRQIQGFAYFLGINSIAIYGGGDAKEKILSLGGLSSMGGCKLSELLSMVVMSGVFISSSNSHPLGQSSQE